MSFSNLYDFLRRLQQNNHKQWMDANRKEYHRVRDFFVEWLDDVNTTLAAIDDDYFDTPGKKAINRINNNLLYHPHKPVYKDHFGAGLDQRTKQGDFYIEFGVNGSFVGGGYWHPSSKEIRSIREAIDYNGEDFQEILDGAEFKNTFGALIDDNPLKVAPKGFSNDHPHIELLKHRSFVVVHYFQPEDTQKDNFKQKLVDAYRVMLPFRRYLNEAVSV